MSALVRMVGQRHPFQSFQLKDDNDVWDQSALCFVADMGMNPVSLVPSKYRQEIGPMFVFPIISLYFCCLNPVFV